MSVHSWLTFIVPEASYSTHTPVGKPSRLPTSARLAGEMEARWAMIDLRLLQAAVTVAEERSVTRAAERLGLTQPALSKQLADLEDRVGFVYSSETVRRLPSPKPAQTL